MTFIIYAQDLVAGSNSLEISGQWRQDFSYMPGILSLALILWEFSGSGVSFFTICPEFYRRLQFSRNFRAVETGFSPFARNFTVVSNSLGISRQWRQFFYYLPGILLLSPILRKFTGSIGRNSEVAPYLLLYLRNSTNRAITNIISMITIVTATEKAEHTHPTISETIGIAIEKIR